MSEPHRGGLSVPERLQVRRDTAWVTLTIDGNQVTVDENLTVLEAAAEIGIEIPALCYLKDLNQIGACRICLVDIEGERNFQPSCIYPVREGLRVRTNSPEVIRARKGILELLLSNHPFDCPTCARNLNCELQTLSKKLNVRFLPFAGERSSYPIDDLSPSVVREPSKCIRCRRCVAVCNEVQEVGIYSMIQRGYESVAGPAYNDSLVDTPCIFCGQCIMVCPVAALHEKHDVDKVWEALSDPDKHVIVQTAPSIRATIGEAFGLPVGTLVTGKMVAALRRLGFDKVFDDCFGADLVVMEESTELMHRLNGGGPLPQFTSCCPGWVNFAEYFYPDLMPHFSTVKSPQQCFGALAKTYYAKKAGIDPTRIFSVSVMPCVAKKFEAQRPEMKSSGYRDVDVVLTTREIIEMIREAGLNLAAMPEEEFDDPMGTASGAGIIFGTTGGVMEAALRTVYEKLTGRQLEPLDFREVRAKTWKEATIDLGDGLKLNVAVARTTGAARKLLDRVIAREHEYDFIEIMACPAGCVGGGGQPIYTEPHSWMKQVDERAARAKALYEQDRLKPVRKAHENPAILKLYAEFLGEPLGEMSRRLLHTHYVARQHYADESSPYPAEVAD